MAAESPCSHVLGCVHREKNSRARVPAWRPNPYKPRIERLLYASPLPGPEFSLVHQLPNEVSAENRISAACPTGELPDYFPLRCQRVRFCQEYSGSLIASLAAERPILRSTR